MLGPLPAIHIAELAPRGYQPAETALSLSTCGTTSCLRRAVTNEDVPQLVHRRGQHSSTAADITRRHSSTQTEGRCPRRPGAGIPAPGITVARHRFWTL